MVEGKLAAADEAFAVHPRLGYLTTRPTIVGTGMELFALLHIPTLTRQGFTALHRTLRDNNLKVGGTRACVWVSLFTVSVWYPFRTARNAPVLLCTVYRLLVCVLGVRG